MQHHAGCLQPAANVRHPCFEDIHDHRWHHDTGLIEECMLIGTLLLMHRHESKWLVRVQMKAWAAALCFALGHLLLPMQPSPHSLPVHLQGSHSFRAGQSLQCSLGSSTPVYIRTNRSHEATLSSSSIQWLCIVSIAGLFEVESQDMTCTVATPTVATSLPLYI